MQSTRTGQAAVFAGAGQPLEVRTYPVGEPEVNTTRLRLAYSGICGTDVHIAEGRLAMPAGCNPGHEFVGIIEAIGEGSATDALGQPIKPGDAAIACIAVPCGKCFNCLNGGAANCLNFGLTNSQDASVAPHFHGGYGEVLFHPTQKLVLIPEGIDLAAAAAFPCAGPTIIQAFMNAGPLQAGELVVVQGTGPVGLFAIAWAASAGCVVAAIGSSSNPERMEMAKSLGATLVWDRRNSTPEQRLSDVQKMAKELNRGDGADVVIEASGAPSAIPEGLSLVRTRGRYLVPGQYSVSGAVEIQPQLITFKAIQISGSSQYTIADLGSYVQFLQNHPELYAAFASTITHRYAISDVNTALANASQGKSIKGVFVA
ncbi:MAG: zinc-binding dehydrogenase [Armatimonadota bacterium]